MRSVGSLNHKMADVDEYLWKSSYPSPLLETGVSWSMLFRATISGVLYISKDGNSITSLSNLCCCSANLVARKVFLMFEQNFPCSSLCPLPLVLPLGTTEKSLALSFLHPGVDSVFFQNKMCVVCYCSWLKLRVIINKYVKAVAWNERSLIWVRRDVVLSCLELLLWLALASKAMSEVT